MRRKKANQKLTKSVSCYISCSHLVTHIKWVLQNVTTFDVIRYWAYNYNALDKTITQCCC